MPRAQVKKIVIEAGKPPKGKPRGKPYSKENPSPVQFKPGQSGNPLGRPKGSGATKISDAYIAALSQEADDDTKIKLGFNLETKLTYADAIALQTVRQAIQPKEQLVDHKSIIELRETTEGKTPEKTEFGGINGAPLNGIPTFAVSFAEPPQREGVTFAQSYPDDKRPHGVVAPPSQALEESGQDDPEQSHEAGDDITASFISE